MLNVVTAITGLSVALTLLAIVATYPLWSSGDGSIVLPGLGLIISSRLLLVGLGIIELVLIGVLFVLLKGN